MKEAIEQKQKEYLSLLPDNAEFKKWLRDSNLWSWVYNIFRISGQNVSKGIVVDMVNGALRNEVPLSCYEFVSNFGKIYSDMLSEIPMNSEPSLRLLERWMKMLGVTARRSNNPVVYEMGLIPCHFREIENEISKCYKKYKLAGGDPLERASVMFLEMIKIYPYTDATVEAAMIMLLYVLCSQGYPIPEFSIGEQEFFSMISSFVDDGNHLKFYEMLQRCIYNRLDVIVMLEKQAMEQEK